MEEKRLQKKKEKAFTENKKDQFAHCCLSLGDLHNDQGNYNKAVKEYETAASIYDEINNKLEMAKANRMIGEMLTLLSEFDAALKHINIYLKIVKDLQNKLELQRAYATLGRVYLLLGQSMNDDNENLMKQLNKAEKAFIQSLLICKELTGQISKIDLLDMQARLYLNIGVVKEHMNDFDESLVYKEKAIKISKSNDIYELLHLCYISTCLLYHVKINNSTLALRYCNLALEVAERLPEKVKKICETLLTKSEIMFKVGDFVSAKQILRKAYKLNTTDLNDKQMIEKTLKIAIAMCNCQDSLIVTDSLDYKKRKILYEKLGDGCCILQNYPKAIEYYLQMLENAQLNGDVNKDLLPIHVSLYQTYKDNKDYDKAITHLWKDFEINRDEPVEAFYALCNIAEIYELQKKSYWVIYEMYQKAIDLAEKYENVKLEKIGLTRLWNLQHKYKMNVLADELKEQAKTKGIYLEILDNDNDSESSETIEQNTPDIGAEICLEDLSDSDDESKSFNSSRTKRTKNLTVKRNNKGETQLHQACISGNLELVKRLIDQGHPINVRDHAGWLPLHEACNHGYKNIVELLLDNGGTSMINDKGGTSCDGITPLYDACSNGFLDVAQVLLERGATATLQTDFGDNSLNILDKWRKSEELNDEEQAQYEYVREKLVKQFDNVKLSPVITNLTSSKSDSIDKNSDNSENSANSSDSEITENISSMNFDGIDSLFSEKNQLKKSNVLKDSNQKEKLKAKSEYKKVMESLKHPNRLQVHGSTSEKIAKKRTGFLGAEEIDDDDWLDDDLGPEKKKRKYFDVIRTAPEPRTNSSTNLRKTFAISLPQKSHHVPDYEDEEVRNAFTLLTESSGYQKHKQNIKLPRTLSSESNGNRKLKHQSSLLDNGFCRFVSSPVPNEEIVNDNFEPDSTTSNNFLFSENPLSHRSPVKIIYSSSSPQQPINQTVSFKIRVEDELLLVPVDRQKMNDINIRWLAEEASRRYYNLIGLKPILRLMTADGFAFEETDTLSAALQENMISSKVMEWKISPLAQRYEEMCHQSNTEMNLKIRSTLETAQISNSLSLQSNYLNPVQIKPILKSLLHQSTLRILDLSDNFIQNDGCKQLGKVLSTLKQLKVLNLQGNCITSEGFEYLSSSILCELELLNLSHNPLGNKSIRNLETFCKNCKKLSKLYLSSCSITSFLSYDLNFNMLIDIDISFNSLDNESFESVLDKLSSCKLQYLNLNYTTVIPNSGVIICEFLESGTCEKFKRVELAACNLTDSDIYKITQNLSKSKELESVTLIGNTKLTTISFQYVLEKLSPQLKRISFDQCPHIFDCHQSLELLNLNCNKIPDLITLNLKDHDDEDENLISSRFEKLKSVWLNYHGDHGKFYKMNSYVCLYLNEADLKGA